MALKISRADQRVKKLLIQHIDDEIVACIIFLHHQKQSCFCDPVLFPAHSDFLKLHVIFFKNALHGRAVKEL